MFGDLQIVWLVMRLWSQVKGGSVDQDTILKLASLLIPILTPLLVRAVAKVSALAVGKLPPRLLPVLAPIIGAILAGLSGVTDPASGAALGLAGVGVREVIDQQRKPST